MWQSIPKDYNTPDEETMKYVNVFVCVMPASSPAV
jgi:hypothetical protein